MSLTAAEFIHRFLQHVLPRGVHKVRYYGIWSPANRELLRRIQLATLPDEPASHDPPSALLSDTQPIPSTPEERSCPRCGKGVLIWTHMVPRQIRPPP